MVIVERENHAYAGDPFRGAGLERINTPLLDWYRENARVLPWRDGPAAGRGEQAAKTDAGEEDTGGSSGRSADRAYRVWVSEIMLQQTRVEAVRPYYERFMTALPDVAALAACPEEQLLKLWEGLGYYSRVRNMQRCAREIVDHWGGEFPADEGQLLKLPGIGPYTAGAIASIAFGLPVPAVDGNVMRVISRVAGSRADIMLPLTRKRIEGALRESLPTGEAGAFNQALMDLGAMVCLPGAKAKCGSCPLASCCACGPQGLTDEIPVRNTKTTKKIQQRTVLVIRDGVRTVLRKRERRGLLAGLFEPPCLEGRASADEAVAYVQEQGLAALRIRPLPEAKHVFTHLIWEMTGYEVIVEDLGESGLDLAEPAGTAVKTEEESGLKTDSGMEMPAGRWFAVETEQVGDRYAIPSAYRAYRERLMGR